MVNREPSQRRVVITGLGIIAPNGTSVPAFWKSIREGISGVGPTTRYDVKKMPVKVSAEVKNFDISRYVDEPRSSKKDLCVQYGLAAALDAVKDAGMLVKEMDPDRIGIVEGTTTSGATNVLKVQESVNGSTKIHPYNAIGGYCGEGSSAIGMELGILGHALTCCSGCASGSDALGYAWRAVRDDDADVMIAGGADAIFPAQHYGFCRLRAMSELDGPPGTQMRPFDKTRDGFVLGEGAAYFILEEMGHALSRGARIYAELLSHGSATPKNDPLETKAIKAVFGQHALRLSVSASKPVTGHTMGASGAIEAAVCALAIHHKEMPPTINHRDPDPACDLDYLSQGARPYPIDVAMNLNAGFGGRYACLLFRRV
jgi:3-oxoacyl-[acyl-carrier-protein] synthase II